MLGVPKHLQISPLSAVETWYDAAAQIRSWYFAGRNMLDDIDFRKSEGSVGS